MRQRAIVWADGAAEKRSEEAPVLLAMESVLGIFCQQLDGFESPTLEHTAAEAACGPGWVSAEGRWWGVAG